MLTAVICLKRNLTATEHLVFVDLKWFFSSSCFSDVGMKPWCHLFSGASVRFWPHNLNWTASSATPYSWRHVFAHYILTISEDPLALKCCFRVLCRERNIYKYKYRYDIYKVTVFCHYHTAFRCFYFYFLWLICSQNLGLKHTSLASSFSFSPLLCPPSSPSSISCQFH